jgi:hypothetical protein
MFSLTGKLLGSWPGLKGGGAGRDVGPFGAASEGDVEGAVGEEGLGTEAGIDDTAEAAGIDGGTVELAEEAEETEEGPDVVVAIVDAKERQHSWSTTRASVQAYAKSEDAFMIAHGEKDALRVRPSAVSPSYM